MRLVLLASAAMMLSSCVGTADLNQCAGADTRRRVYETGILAVDVAVATGQAVPAAALKARDAAVLALRILNDRCLPAPTL